MEGTPARTIRDAMHQGCECIGEGQTLLEAAERMEQLDIGVMPICGDDERLTGMLTDRDIVVKRSPNGMVPAATTRRPASSLRAGSCGLAPTRPSTRRSA